MGLVGALDFVPTNIPIRKEFCMANKDSYVLPKATRNTLGGVRVGKGLSIDDEGVLKCPAVLDKIVENEYVLPKATMFKLGGVKVGKGLSIDDEGRLDSSNTFAASSTQIGGVIIGDGINVDANGRISVDIPKNLSEFANDSDFKTGSDVRALISEHNSASSAHELAIKLAIQKYMDENGTGGGGSGGGSVSGGLPTGSITAYAGKFTPSGWLLCDGSSVSRTDYPELYATIGTTYGSGDGRTTFNLPMLTDNRFIEGYPSPGQRINPGLPNIRGTGQDFIVQCYQGNRGTPPFKLEYNKYNHLGWQDKPTNLTDLSFLTFDASLANNIYGASDTVQPKSLTMRYIIKC